MYRDTPVHVIIPAYNVAPHIEGVLAGLPPFVDRITVVDDASTDDTAARVARVAERDGRIELLRHPENQGVGGAMVTGLRRALEQTRGILVKMDGDGQMDPGLLPDLLDPLVEGRAEYAKGNRFLRGHALARMPRVRLFGNFVLTFLTKLASGYWHVFDPQNGYLAMRSEVVALLDLDRLARRYFFENDMLVNLNIFDVRVVDVAMEARYGDETSSMNLWEVVFTFPCHLFRRYWYRFYQKHVLRDFSPVALFMLLGLPLLSWGVLFGGYTWLHSILHGVYASTGTVMLSVLPFLVGFELVLQAIVLEIHASPRGER
ncbi:MAG: glycosyltransferase family 2 protein [Nitrospirae bacterium]|nr:MAG: glycosyltransferase family 2 protein [Nitrospirota bacterium]